MPDMPPMIGLVLSYVQAVLVRDALEAVNPDGVSAQADREYLVAKLDEELRKAGKAWTP